MILDESPITLRKSRKRGQAQPDETQVSNKRRRFSSQKHWSWLLTPDFVEPVISCPMLLDESVCSHLGELEARNRSITSLHLSNSPIASDKITPNGSAERVRRTLSRLKISVRGVKCSKMNPNGKLKRPHNTAQLKKNGLMDGTVTREPVKEDENFTAMASHGLSPASRASLPISAIHCIDKSRLRKLREDLRLR